jgi:hypothetical protein
MTFNPKEMAKKKRGRPRVTHGGYALLITGEPPEHRPYLRPELIGAHSELVYNLGPTEDDLTAAQKILIGRVIAHLGIVRCIEEHIKDKGVLKNGELHPALSTQYLAYSNSIRLNLAALGIDKRRGSEILDLGKYIDAKAKEAPEPAGGRDEAADAGQVQDGEEELS